MEHRKQKKFMRYYEKCDTTGRTNRASTENNIIYAMRLLEKLKALVSGDKSNE